jgi:hypothetical protein
VTEREPDVEIVAAARVGEVRLGRQPHISVVVRADVEAEAESVSVREGLPDRLEPGVTYENGAVYRRIAAWIGRRS